MFPFGKAQVSDNWFKLVDQKDWDTFWKKTDKVGQCKVSFEFKSLMEGMLEVDPSKRLTINELVTHSFFMDKTDCQLISEPSFKESAECSVTSRKQSLESSDFDK